MLAGSAALFCFTLRSIPKRWAKQRSGNSYRSMLWSLEDCSIEVGTTCGSGWVNDRHFIVQGNEGGLLTHPLPQVVPTSCQLRSLTFETKLKRAGLISTMLHRLRSNMFWQGFAVDAKFSASRRWNLNFPPTAVGGISNYFLTTVIFNSDGYCFE